MFPSSIQSALGTSTRLATLVVLLTALLASSPATSQTLGYSITLGGNLVEVDVETGAFTVVGDLDVSSIRGLAMDSGGMLWGVSFGDLWQIDPADAATSRVGDTGILVEIAAGLTFDACGRLWLVSDGALYEMDPTTGAATFRADLPEELGALTARGETLFGLTSPTPRLSTIDPDTGNLDVYGDEVPYFTELQWLDFDATGQLWGGLSNDIPVIPTWGTRILRFESLTGAFEEVVANTGNFRGNLAIAPPSGTCGSLAEDIPLDDPAALAAMALLLAWASLLLLRRS